ncbi:hypothetical protein HDV00_011808 [Rhizophlyctis rosea]|nr:hypothetical protein HDV00_011808 [Rhizophlyctis rosea]
MKRVLEELSKNPQARQVFEAIQKDPTLLLKVQELGLLLQRKGYIDPSRPAKQPGITAMARMFADSEVRNLMMEIGQLLQKAGIDMRSDGASMAQVFGLLGSGAAPPARTEPPEPTHRGVMEKLKNTFKKR